MNTPYDSPEENWFEKLEEEIHRAERLCFEARDMAVRALRSEEQAAPAVPNTMMRGTLELVDELINHYHTLGHKMKDGSGIDPKSEYESTHALNVELSRKFNELEIFLGGKNE